MTAFTPLSRAEEPDREWRRAWKLVLTKRHICDGATSMMSWHGNPALGSRFRGDDEKTEGPSP
jgi:hypothetical protein